MSRARGDLGEVNGEPVVKIVGVTKNYPGVRALSSVDLEIFPGRVTALAGENGAGKSTLIKVISGAVSVDEGEVFIGGRLIGQNPKSAIEAGVSVIYQELTTIPDMSVLDNVLLGQQKSVLGVINGRAGRTIAREAMERAGLGDIPLGTRAGSLSLGQRQLLEIARCLVRDAKVLVFDEPTSSLPSHDVDVLFDIIQSLKRSGIGILYVSHHLEEMFRIADDILVMRDGVVVADADLDQWTEESLIHAMLAKDLGNAYPWYERDLGPALLDVEGLVAPGVKSAEIHVRRSEIVGLVGLAGAGRTELMKALSGVVRRRSGRVAVSGGDIRNRGLTSARRAGIIYAPEDRKDEGLILGASVRDNLGLGLFGAFSYLRSIVSSRRLGSFVSESIARFGVKVGSSRQAVGTLSGGNQQKVILARVAYAASHVILLDDPTRGVDVGAKYGIYESVLELAKSGMGVVLTSSDTDEVLAMCDRVYVMRGGKTVSEFSRERFDRLEILAAATLNQDSPAEAVYGEKL